MARFATAMLVAAALAPTAQAGGRLWRPWTARRACPPRATAPALPTPPMASNGPAMAALNLINAERARLGRGPLRWSITLASFAATNAGVHQPGSSGGAGQCWAGMTDPVQAASAWLASPPHRAILMGATTECGIARCPTGTTANAR